MLPSLDLFLDMNTEFLILRAIFAVQNSLWCAKVQSILVAPHFVCNGYGIACQESFFLWPCWRTLIRVTWEEGTMASAEIALGSDLKLGVDC